MKQVGVIANTGKPHAPQVLARVASRSRALGLQLVTCDETAELLPDARRLSHADFLEQIDVVMACGGDGTMLRSVRLLNRHDVPVLGVNLGSLGFMTSVPEEEAERAVEVLAAGTYTTSRRTLAYARLVRNDACLAEYHALNDLVIGWGASSRVIALTVELDGVEVTSYKCDGLILSTPTGSTGHSLSAGGPILHPETPAFVISLVCPHTLSSRPLVLPDDGALRIKVSSADKTLLLAIDGQEGHTVEQGDVLEVTRSPTGVRFIHLPDYNYFSVLRHKLGWRGSHV
jgi:NAD+ kinase